jgi:Integrase core domain
VLRRHGLQRLDWMDRPSGEVIRRYERERPGELIHVDVKKLGRIPRGGGWRALGRQPGLHNVGVGYDYVHSAVDDHSHLAYSEIHANERADTCAGFLVRAREFYAAHGVAVERVMTDNAKAYRDAHAFREAARLLGVRQVFTRSHRPQTNGKVERFNRTLLEEWAYVRPYLTNEQRTGLLEGWLHLYKQPSVPHRARRPPTHRSCQQPFWELQLGRRRPRETRIAIWRPKVKAEPRRSSCPVRLPARVYPPLSHCRHASLHVHCSAASPSSSTIVHASIDIN